MCIPNSVYVRMMMSGVRRMPKAFNIGIIVFSASQVGATLYIDSEDSDVSTYWIEKPCCTTISVPSEIVLAPTESDT